MKKLLVKCSFEIPIEVDDYADYDSLIFDIEENHCPGTGIVGAAFNKHYKKFSTGKYEHFCWACALNGKNEIIDFNYKKSL